MWCQQTSPEQPRCAISTWWISVSELPIPEDQTAKHKLDFSARMSDSKHVEGGKTRRNKYEYHGLKDRNSCSVSSAHCPSEAPLNPQGSDTCTVRTVRTVGRAMCTDQYFPHQSVCFGGLLGFLACKTWRLMILSARTSMLMAASILLIQTTTR